MDEITAKAIWEALEPVSKLTFLTAEDKRDIAAKMIMNSYQRAAKFEQVESKLEHEERSK